MDTARRLRIAPWRRVIAGVQCLSLAGAVWVGIALGIASSPSALAQGLTPSVAPSTDPVLEQRVLQVAEGLRCLVCQNETIAASQAELAQDLRAQIREQLRAGRDEAQIRDYMVARYGDFILYRPPWQASTVLLWLGPFALLALALLALRSVLRSQSAARESAHAVPPAEAAEVTPSGTTGDGALTGDELRGLALLQGQDRRALKPATERRA